MTMEQKKVIRAAVLTPMFLLLAIGIFDARHGNLAAQGKTRNIASSGNMDFRKAEAGLDRKSTRLNSSHIPLSRMPSSA